MLELLEGEIREHLSEQPTDLVNSNNDTEKVIAVFTLLSKISIYQKILPILLQIN